MESLILLCETKICEIMTGHIDEWETLPLNSKQRAQLYEIFRDKYPTIDIISVPVLGVPEKKLMFSKIKNESKNKITSETINFFSTYSRTHIPVCNPDYLQYYLDNMDKYFNCNTQYCLFLEDLQNMEFYQLRKEATVIMKKVGEYIKNNKEYQKFTTIQSSIVMPNDLVYNSNLYSSVNTNKLLISIDVKSANFTTLKHFCPSVTDLTWVEFISQFTKSKFLIQSKQFREIIFGELGNNKIHKLPILFIAEVAKFVSENDKYNKCMKKVFCSNDEIVYEVVSEVGFNIIEFTKNINELKPNYFRIEMYKLVQLGKLPYFVKEHIDGKKEFKNIPKKFLMQCIKYYEQKEVIEVDRKFTDESGLIATFDCKLEFE